MATSAALVAAVIPRLLLPLLPLLPPLQLPLPLILPFLPLLIVLLHLDLLRASKPHSLEAAAAREHESPSVITKLFAAL
jgi:hypothetical protein